MIIVSLELRAEGIPNNSTKSTTLREHANL